MTSLLAHAVRLALVLGHAGVDRLDNVRADGRLEDIRKGEGVLAGGAIGAVNGNDGSAGHFVAVWLVVDDDCLFARSQRWRPNAVC